MRDGRILGFRRLQSWRKDGATEVPGESFGYLNVKESIGQHGARDGGKDLQLK